VGRKLLSEIDDQPAARDSTEGAIEIANALLEEGHEEGRAIRIAIAKPKEWAAQCERSR
jgi:uncharacterized protein YdaT